MSFNGGLAASPDPSNDVLVEQLDERAAHHQLFHDAYTQLQKFHDARQYTDPGDESQETYGSFKFTNRDLESLPGELVDVIGEHATRLALGWNRLTGLSSLGPRFSEFKSLKYLNMRNNLLQEFPRPLLDLHANYIDSLPEDLWKLKNLKKFAMDRNQVTRIPTCIAHMGSLHFIDTRSNPIEFPDKATWKLRSKLSEDSTRDTSDYQLTDETKRLKRALLQLAKSERSPESEHSESTTDTPRPARKRTGGGRFPIRPSMSGTNVDATSGSQTNSPIPARPGLRSLKTMHASQAPRNPPSRPGVAPLVSKDRHRSNSESQMSTNRRQKRMGIHVSRGGSGNSSAEVSLDGIDLTKERSSHARGTSAGSLLHQVMQGHGVTDSSGPESPITADLSRSASYYEGQRRLSSLAESKRKSQYNNPFVELADAVLFSMGQMELPLKKLVNLTGSTGSKRRSLERSYHSAFASKGDLNEALYNLEVFDEGDGSKRKSLLSIREQCEMCLQGYQSLLQSMQSYSSSVSEKCHSRDLRMMVHIAFAVKAEVKYLSTRVADTLSLDEDDRQENIEAVEERAAHHTSPSPRPKTSLRVQGHARVTHHHHQSSNLNKPLPSPKSARSISGASLLSRMPSHASNSARLQDSYNPPTPSLTHSNSFLSTASTEAVDEYEEDQMFEAIFQKLQDACNKSLQGLPHCRKIFVALRESHRGAPAQIPGADELYEHLLQNCNYALDACTELKKRLKTLKVREPQARQHIEFWQVCTAFTKAYFVFASTVRNSHYPGLVPDEVRTLLRPVQKAVKEASTLIDQSPWRHLAVHGPNSAGPSPAVNGSLPFSMSNSQPMPSVLAPPTKDLPARPTNHSSQPGNGLGLQTSWVATANLTRSDTLSSNNSGATLRAAPTSHPSLVNGTSTPGNLSRSHSRTAGLPSVTSTSNPAPASTPAFNSSFGSSGSFGSSHFLDPVPSDSRAPDNRYPPMPDSRYPSSDTRYNSMETPGSGTRSGYSSGYVTPLPATPMSAALGPAAQATAPGENDGTIRRVNSASTAHEKQNSWDDVVGGYSNSSYNSYNGNASGSSTSLAGISGSLRSGLAGPNGLDRIDRPERPDVLPRSVSAAGYYPSAVPVRMGSRNVSRSASQRR